MTSSAVKAIVVILGVACAGTAQAEDFSISRFAQSSSFFSFALKNAPRFAAPASRPVLNTQAQVYGQRCVTPIGSCQIPQQPVGTPCACGSVQGTTYQ